ncbi:MAG TPA: SDR family NAD(P)-dependent oxidoreductase, partial [Agromyces sp.]|nr:SDR family NAD(P)-dependent oxidoreductase [Agromyces sp.]
MNANIASLRGRTGVVTGASSGMGAAVALRLARTGADVAAIGRRADRLAGLVGAASDAPGRIVPIPADVTSDGDVEAAISLIHDELGSPDLLVNAAGVMLPNPLADGRADEWQRMI